MSKIRIDITKNLQPLFKSIRQAAKVVGEEASKAVNKGEQMIRDIESGKLSIVATVEVKKTAKAKK